MNKSRLAAAQPRVQVEERRRVEPARPVERVNGDPGTAQRLRPGAVGAEAADLDRVAAHGKGRRREGELAGAAGVVEGVDDVEDLHGFLPWNRAAEVVFLPSPPG